LDDESADRSQSDEAAATNAEAIQAADKQGAMGGYAAINADLGLGARYSLRMWLNAGGRYVVSGIGAGVDDAKQGEAKNVHDNLARMAAVISNTELAKALSEWKSSRATDIREVIASELRPGGMLYRAIRGR
jgi:hypothetical protein